LILPTFLPILRPPQAPPVALYETLPISAVEPATGTPSNGGLVNAMDDQTGGGHDAVQATGASKPSLDNTIAAGAYLVRFSSADNLQAATPGGAGDVFFQIVASLQVAPQRDIVSRDTSAATTLPAYYVRIKEDLE
jgi:hypothetical protein